MNVQRTSTIFGRDPTDRMFHTVRTLSRFLHADPPSSECIRCVGHKRDKPRTNADSLRLACAVTIVCVLAATGSGHLATASTPNGALPLSEDGRGALALLDGVEVRELIPAFIIADRGTLLGLRPGTWTYRLTAGANRGREWAETLRPLPGYDDGVHWERTSGGYFVETLAMRTPTELALLSWTDERHGVAIQIEANSEILDAPIGPEETVTTHSAIAVSRRRSRGPRVHRGRLTTTYTYEGAFRVTTPAGAFDAILLRTDRDIHVGPARARDTRFSFYADGVGKVAETEECAFDGLYRVSPSPENRQGTPSHSHLPTEPVETAGVSGYGNPAASGTEIASTSDGTRAIGCKGAGHDSFRASAAQLSSDHRQSE